MCIVACRPEQEDPFCIQIFRAALEPDPPLPLWKGERLGSWADRTCSLVSEYCKSPRAPNNPLRARFKGGRKVFAADTKALTNGSLTKTPTSNDTNVGILGLQVRVTETIFNKTGAATGQCLTFKIKGGKLILTSQNGKHYTYPENGKHIKDLIARYRSINELITTFEDDATVAGYLTPFKSALSRPAAGFTLVKYNKTAKDLSNGTFAAKQVFSCFG